jgi:hypothetical protein
MIEDTAPHRSYLLGLSPTSRMARIWDYEVSHPAEGALSDENSRDHTLAR